MSSQRTAILAVGLAALMVFCAVAGAFILADNSSNTTSSTDVEKNKNADIIVVGDSQQIKSYKDASLPYIVGGGDFRSSVALTSDVVGEAIVIPSRPAGQVGTNDLQIFLLTYCSDTSVNFVQYMIDHIVYKGQEFKSVADVASRLVQEQFQLSNDNMILTNSNDMIPLEEMTVEDFLCQAVSFEEPGPSIQIGVVTYWFKG